MDFHIMRDIIHRYNAIIAFNFDIIVCVLQVSCETHLYHVKSMGGYLFYWTFEHLKKVEICGVSDFNPATETIATFLSSNLYIDFQANVAQLARAPDS